MNDKRILQKALKKIQRYVKAPILRSLTFDSIEARLLDWYLARLSHAVQPSYFPFASDSTGVLCAYLKPEMDLLASPIVYIDFELRNVHFVCESFSALPTGLWLWVAHYFKEDVSVLRRNIYALAQNLPNAKRPPKALWPILKNSGEYEPTWWTGDCRASTQMAWTVGNVGHPFVGLPQIPFRATPEAALSLLRPFIDKRREPELLSVRVATQLKAGISVEKADVLAVLQAEAWRQAYCFLRPARWRVSGSGKGLCAWDTVLSNLPNPHSVLSDTKLAFLADHQDAYGQNHSALLELARRLQKQGAFTLALSQARNAVRVSILSGDEYDVASAQLSAELCHTISSNSIAAAVARRTVQIDRDDL